VAWAIALPALGPGVANAQSNDLVLDLLPSQQHGQAVELQSGLAENFRVVIKHRAPGARYRVTQDWTLSPSTKHLPSESLLHMTRDLQMPPPTMLQRQDTWKQCHERQHEVLTATQESEMPGKLLALREAAEDPSCRYGNAVVEQALQYVEPNLNSFRLYAGDELRFRVERMGSDSGEAERVWRFVIRPSRPRLDWTYPSEEAWIVAEVSRDVAEMLAYAREPAFAGRVGLAVKRQEDPSHETPRYLVSASVGGGAPLECLLSFQESLWSPESFLPLATGLMERLALAPTGRVRADLEPVLEMLTRPMPVDLRRESARVSARLAESMLDPAGHEEAALVLAALGLREAAGEFSDVRQTLNRMAAHLTVVRALGAEGSGYGRAALLTLQNRQRDALELIGRMQAENPEGAGAAVLRALRIRNTRDWRILTDPASATLLERLEQQRALEQSIGSAAALEFVQSFTLEPMTDWGRLAFVFDADDEQGELFGESLLPLELEAAGEAWTAFHSGELTNGVLEELEAPAQRLIEAGEDGRPTPVVVGWGDWAQFHQRNVCFAAQARVSFLRNDRDTLDEARQLGLELYEVIRPLPLCTTLGIDLVSTEVAPGEDPRETRRWVAAGRRAREEGCRNGVEAIQSAPETISAAPWYRLHSHCVHERESESIPPPARWFDRLVPFGSALYDEGRSFAWLVGGVPRGEKRDLSGTWPVLVERAPYDRLILYVVTKDEPLETVADAYRPLLEYDVRAIRHVALLQKDDVETYRGLYERLSTIDPDYYLLLGDYLANRNRPEAAADAFERGVERARNRSAVVRRLPWLVGQQLDLGRTDRATELAEMAAAAGSAEGLRAMGYLMERLGRYQEAVEWYGRIAEEHGLQKWLDFFYIRHDHRFGDGQFAPRASEAWERVFPEGLIRVALEDFLSPPVAGGFPLDRMSGTDGFELEVDDLVVALDGYRVANPLQYELIWTLADGPEVSAIVWRDDRYVEVRGTFRRMRHDPLPGVRALRAHGVPAPRRPVG